MRFLPTRFYLALGIGLLIASCVSPQQSERHALIIGIDGVRPDALLAASTPNFDSLVENGRVSWNAYAGGSEVAGDPSRQATSSGPGWTSILTGVWRNQHGVQDNSFEGYDQVHYPHLFQRIRDERPEASLVSIVNWVPIHEHLLAPFPGIASALIEHNTDAGVATAAREQLSAGAVDVLFLHFDEVDGAGHGFGYSTEVPEYIAAIEAADLQLGRVLEALRLREEDRGEKWMVIATTDHGGLHKSHGGQSKDEREIWVVAKGPGIEPGLDANGPGHTIVTRTVLEHMGIQVEDAWGLVDANGFGMRRP